MLDIKLLLVETNICLKRKRYRKAYKYCNKPFQYPLGYFEDDSKLTLYIQLNRRLTAICLYLLEKYTFLHLLKLPLEVQRKIAPSPPDPSEIDQVDRVLVHLSLAVRVV